MSAVKVIVNLLANSGALIAAVPAVRHFVGPAPADALMPALSIELIGDAERHTVAMNNTTVLVRARVQVTVLADTYADLDALQLLVRKACPNQSGTVASVALDSILPQEQGPDLKLEDAGIFTRSRDFLVTFNQSL